MFYFLLLPPIIFEAGYSLNRVRSMATTLKARELIVSRCCWRCWCSYRGRSDSSTTSSSCLQAMTSTQRSDLTFSSCSTIALFAVLGTMISTFVIGYLTYYAGTVRYTILYTSLSLHRRD
jgi:beta-lactamase regulating signal transducer with metallopeptidase domain